MHEAGQQKVIARHLQRKAFLYVRQSTLKQVLENSESTKRQYDLRQRAVALGWPLEEIVVIDSDLGQSGASTDREGFQRLVSEVGLGNAGIVMGLEVSRLARNSTDWHRLLEICALSDTLILDEDGVYDPAHFNDRLLLGLKGTMSEAELHVLRARLRGGIMNKARRGELVFPLPVGLAYDDEDRVILEPDAQVQQALHTFFATFRRTGSALATVKYFLSEKLLFPSRGAGGARTPTIRWTPLYHTRAVRLLHNPRYAGVFAFGRTRVQYAGGKAARGPVSREDWIAFIPNAHPGYITLEQFEENERVLEQNARAQRGDRRRTPPREGPALLQGLVVCGRCGRRMTLRYHQRSGGLEPTYVCDRIEEGEPACQLVPGGRIDDAVGDLLLARMSPLEIETAFAVQRELEARHEDADRLRAQHVERVKQEAELARRRYMKTNPDNRLVADVLEADWNARLRDYTSAQEEYAKQRDQTRRELNEDQRAAIRALATDLPRLWRDPRTPAKERKRLVRLLVEDVTIARQDDIRAHVRLRGGATASLTIARPSTAAELRRTPAESVREIDRLLDMNTAAEVAESLNARGFSPGVAASFTARRVVRIQVSHGLRSRYERLREQGMLTLQEVAQRLGVCMETAKIWRRQGRLHTARVDEKCHLYAPLGADAPTKYEWHRRRVSKQSSRRKGKGGAV